VSLKGARGRRDEARKLLANDVDPGEVRKAERVAKAEAGANTFEALAREWMATRGKEWSASYAGKTQSALERHAFPSIGNRPIGDVTAPDLLALLRAIEKRGTVDMAHRIQQHCGAIFRYAIATGRARYDPVPSLAGALATVKQQHFAAITDPAEFAQLLRDIDNYRGEATTKAAMQLLSLTFQRTKEVRFAEWSQIDAPAALWRIPAEVMKMKEAHIVPLSRQALTVLEELRPLTGAGRLIFPSAIGRERPISENTVTYGLARMGYKGRMTGHGFRSVASTLLNEHGFRHDVIERQLAHAERNAVRAAYNRAEYLPERTKMMQQWADYLDQLKAGAAVIPINRAA
jgi:integrase